LENEDGLDGGQEVSEDSAIARELVRKSNLGFDGSWVWSGRCSGHGLLLFKDFNSSEEVAEDSGWVRIRVWEVLGGLIVGRHGLLSTWLGLGLG
jgi:hypothetical protein